MDIIQAKEILAQLIYKPKYEAMIYTASVVTQLLAPFGIKPIIVGGLSVEIYTQQEYATRDIDFVSDGYQKITDILFSLDFKKEGRHFYRDDIEIAIEIPDNYLAGDYSKVNKVQIDDDGHYVYLISAEDIILDRLRAAVHWHSEEDSIWAFRLLSRNFTHVDLDDLRNRTETKTEREVLEEWIEQTRFSFNIQMNFGFFYGKNVPFYDEK